MHPQVCAPCCAAAAASRPPCRRQGRRVRVRCQKLGSKAAPPLQPVDAVRLLQAMKAAAEVMEDPSKTEQYRSVDPKLYAYLQALLGQRR